MATEDEIHAWLAGYHRNWDQLCQALMWQLANKFGTVVSTPQSAIEAYYIELNAGRIRGGDAPPGSFVYWAIGQYGHVGYVMNDGRTLMATTNLAEEWTVRDAGWNTSAGYEAMTGARSLGWSYQNGGNSVPFTPGGGGGGGGGVNYHWYELSADAMAALQRAGARHGTYTGPIDGDFGENSVKSTQQILKDIGLLPADYVVDGVPHNANPEDPSNYGFALQKLAATAGYDGLMDGLPAGYTSQFLVPAADALFTKPTPEPEPEPEPPAIPPLPPVPEGYKFLPDLGTSQSTFDFAEYVGAGGEWAALKMGGGNASDSPYTAPAYLDQRERAEREAVELIVYWFNGRKNGVTPQSSADYFAAHSLFKVGDIAAMDIEAEKATDTAPWTPAEAVAYALRLQVHYPGVGGLFYLSKSVYDGDDWSPLEALGWYPWIASWGSNSGDPENNPPGDELVWQYTSNETVPGNYTGAGADKVYHRTDGNIARADLFELLAYVEAPEPEPEPEPEPTPDHTTKTLGEFFVAQAALNAEFAEVLTK